MGNWSAQQILTQVTGELGLPAPRGLASNDAQTTQLYALLNAAGNELLFFPWERFKKTWTFTTQGNEGAYSLPADFGYFELQTQYNRSSGWPLQGPKSPQEWAWIKNSKISLTTRFRYRIIGGKFSMLPVPEDAQEISMEYMCNTWIQPSDSTKTPKSMVDDPNDIVLYDPWLIVKFIKLKFYELKGFDTTGVRTDFMRVFGSLTGRDEGARVLSMVPGGSTSFYIGDGSIPESSWNE